MDSFLPVSNFVKLQIFYFLNCLMLAIIITIILLWIIKILNNYIVGLITVIILGTCSPLFLMYGKNLYWCTWTLYLPMASMVLLLNSKIFTNSQHPKKLLFTVAFLSCFIKCLFYFEFISTVMISMMIPVIYYLLSSDKSIKDKIITFALTSLGAILGFLFVNFIKYIMLCYLFNSTSIALSTITNNLEYRLLGITIHTDSPPPPSLLYVLFIMLTKPFISIKYIFEITNLGLTGITCLLFIISFYLKIFKHNKKIFKFAICTAISLLAPLSWFILAKPHTAIHNHHCSINWFLPFNIMSFAFICNIIIDLIKRYNSSKKSLV